jgi:hypothetical protein
MKEEARQFLCPMMQPYGGQATRLEKSKHEWQFPKQEHKE